MLLYDLFCMIHEDGRKRNESPVKCRDVKTKIFRCFNKTSQEFFAAGIHFLIKNNIWFFGKLNFVQGKEFFGKTV